MLLDRRTFLALLGAGLAAPTRVARADSAFERKFLFVYCDGGWDTLKVFTPIFDSTSIDQDGHSEPASAHGIDFVHSDQRPSVTSFFEAYGDRCCVVNGMEVRSITHERCRRILLTGAGDGGRDDWGAILAGHSQLPDKMLPHLIMAGTSFTDRYIADVVRVGDNGQLPELIDASALERSTLPVSVPSSELEALEDAFLRERVAEVANGAAPDRSLAFAERYGAVLDQMQRVQSASDLDLSSGYDGCNRHLGWDASVIFNCMEQGLTRCGMVRSDGVCDFGWDSHSQLHLQDMHYESLFAYLSGILEDLDSRTSHTGNPLADEVTIVLVSEMGRHPRINSANGRDHWTYTSFMLLGSGIRGGQVIGGLTDEFIGRPVDLATGETTDSGVSLVPKHLGATLLALGDVDPEQYVPEVDVLEAALS